MTETMLRTRLARRSSGTGGSTARRWVRDLERKGRLDDVVLEAQETTGDLLYELESVKKMNYRAAWELATQESAFPPERESGGDHERGPPAAGEPLRDLDPREFSVGDLAPAAPAAPPRDFRIVGARELWVS